VDWEKKVGLFQEGLERRNLLRLRLLGLEKDFNWYYFGTILGPITNPLGV